MVCDPPTNVLEEYVKENGSELIGLMVAQHKNGYLNIGSLLPGSMKLTELRLAQGAINEKQYQQNDRIIEDIKYFNENIRPHI